MKKECIHEWRVAVLPESHEELRVSFYYCIHCREEIYR